MKKAPVSVVVAAAAPGALTQEEREDRAGGIGCPLPEFGTAIEAPRADVFVFVGVHCSEVLAHRKGWKGITKERGHGEPGSTVASVGMCGWSGAKMA